MRLVPRIAIVLLCLALPSAALAQRPQPLSRVIKAPHQPTVGGLTVQQVDLTQALQCLIGPDVTITNATLTGAPNAVGSFSGGSGIVGIDQGLVLSSGDVTSIVGPNLLDDTSTNNDLLGDADLDALIPGYSTFDATVLEFDFTCSQPTVMSFQYVFASEEYNEWVNSPFNDVFGFFLNGVNIAITPAACSAPGIPVAINNVNCGNPYSLLGGGPNCDCYRNNDLDDAGGLINTEMDGLTQVFYATATIQPGTNHMKLAVADAGDHILDSNVLLACQSFTCASPPATGGCCIDGDCFLLGQDQCARQGGVFLGIGSSCIHDACDLPSPARPTTWGKIKSLYR